MPLEENPYIIPHFKALIVVKNLGLGREVGVLCKHLHVIVQLLAEKLVVLLVEIRK